LKNFAFLLAALAALFIASSAQSQILDTVAGVRLEGVPSDPVAVNGSDQAVLALKVVFDLGERQFQTANKLFVDPGRALQPGGRSEIRQAGPLRLNLFGVDNKTGASVSAAGMVKGVKLAGVVFADGSFVGTATDAQVAAIESQFQRIRNMAEPETRRNWTERGMAKGIADALSQAERSGDATRLKSMEEHYRNLPVVHREKETDR
jgi:hypothetical protein